EYRKAPEWVIWVILAVFFAGIAYFVLPWWVQGNSFAHLWSADELPAVDAAPLQSAEDSVAPVS
ncbi:MAG: hypothetical protein AAB901_01015, partial [Patescibacteria group bacterium]